MSARKPWKGCSQSVSAPLVVRCVRVFVYLHRVCLWCICEMERRGARGGWKKMCDQQQQQRRANDPQRREAVSDELTVPLIPTKSLSLGDEMNYNFSNFSFLALLLFNPRLLRRRRPRVHLARRSTPLASPFRRLHPLHFSVAIPLIKSSKSPVFRPNGAADVENPSTLVHTRVLKICTEKRRLIFPQQLKRTLQ